MVDPKPLIRHLNIIRLNSNQDISYPLLPGILSLVGLSRCGVVQAVEDYNLIAGIVTSISGFAGGVIFISSERRIPIIGYIHFCENNTGKAINIFSTPIYGLNSSANWDLRASLATVSEKEN